MFVPDTVDKHSPLSDSLESTSAICPARADVTVRCHLAATWQGRGVHWAPEANTNIRHRQHGTLSLIFRPIPGTDWPDTFLHQVRPATSHTTRLSGHLGSTSRSASRSRRLLPCLLIEYFFFSSEVGGSETVYIRLGHSGSLKIATACGRRLQGAVWAVTAPRQVGRGRRCLVAQDWVSARDIRRVLVRVVWIYR